MNPSSLDVEPDVEPTQRSKPLSAAQRARNHLGNVKSRPSATPEQILEAEAGLAAGKIETAIERIVADAPPITEAAAARLSALLFRSAGLTASSER